MAAPRIYFYAPVKADGSFPVDAKGRTPIYKKRSDCQNACRAFGWPRNIGMGRANWERFRASHDVVLDPPVTVLSVPTSQRGKPMNMGMTDQSYGLAAMAVAFTAVLLIMFAARWGWFDKLHRVKNPL
mmetsp:Transcript_81760/g.227692  ORF Transcript_81760/g.227692 Transcript_81760/m.227692 type:complete len:128 (+) Transcript_81760:276-659(+)